MANGPTKVGSGVFRYKEPNGERVPVNAACPFLVLPDYKRQYPKRRWGEYGPSPATKEIGALFHGSIKKLHDLEKSTTDLKQGKLDVKIQERDDNLASKIGCPSVVQDAPWPTNESGAVINERTPSPALGEVETELDGLSQ